MANFADGVVSHGSALEHEVADDANNILAAGFSQYAQLLHGLVDFSGIIFKPLARTLPIIPDSQKLHDLHKLFFHQYFFFYPLQNTFNFQDIHRLCDVVFCSALVGHADHFLGYDLGDDDKVDGWVFFFYFFNQFEAIFLFVYQA